jgi:uncharacterized membrane protein YkvA (DUF1232 family)
MAVLARLAAGARALRQELRVWRLVLADRRTPLVSRLLLWLAVGYLLLPFDLVPDFIPVLGQLDDLIIVPGLVVAALWLVPREVVADCRARAAAGEGTAARRESPPSVRS